MAAGEEETAWFERHNSTPITDLPAHWPPAYRAIVERRIKLIEEHPYIRLLERPEHKRRWQREPWEKQVQAALYDWLCNRLEDRRYWPPEPRLVSCAQLTDLLRADADFLQVANLYRGSDVYDLQALVQELVAAESVPYLPVLRYTESGLRKRAEWEQVWELQRREDAGEKPETLGEIPVPPRYDSKDFRKSTYWRHRGKLDVPKERFVAYPGAERAADSSTVITWAGYDHLQQARALAAYFMEAKEQEGWPVERLLPPLAGLDQLVPWIRQWHNALDPAISMGMGDYFASFVENQARALGVTPAAVRACIPPPPPAAPRARRSKRSGTPTQDRQPEPP